LEYPKRKETLPHNPFCYDISMHLTVVRHGETEENAQRTIQGHNHGRLSAVGEKQVKKLASKLKNENFDIIYSSDLQRAVDTAVAIQSEHKKTPVIYNPALRELRVRAFQGLPVYLFQWGAKLRNYLPISLFGIESTPHAKQRIVSFINSTAEQYPKGNILFVSHGGPIRIMRSIFEDKPLNKLTKEEIPNSSIWKFEVDAPISTKQKHTQ